MINTLTEILHISITIISFFTAIKGLHVYFSKSNDLSRTLNRFVQYATLISFLIFTADLYRFTIDQPYVGGSFALYAYFTQLASVLLARNIIKTAKDVAEEY